MAKSLSTILNQIERLQKEAAGIQSEVIGRIRKEIAKFGLTAEQLFGTPTVARGRAATGKSAAAKKVRAIKYADDAGNTWGGMGKRPEWVRSALAAGKTLEEFLVARAGASTQQSKAAPKRTAKAKAPAVKRAATAAKKPIAKKAAARKPRSKPAAGEATAG